MTPEQQQDNFILSFLQWVNKNYEQIGDDEYHPFGAEPTFQNEVMCLTAQQCLELYRKQQIPPLLALPLPSPPLQSDTKHLAVIKEYSRINTVLLNGFFKIQTLLSNGANVPEAEINDIIFETMSQIP